MSKPPSPEVRKEIERLIERDASATSTNYRWSVVEGLSDREVADRRGIDTDTSVWRDREKVSAILEGQVRDSLAREIRGYARTLRNTPGLSDETGEYLDRIIQHCDDVANRKNDRPGWFVGSMIDGEDQTKRFLEQGVWENGYDSEYQDLVNEMMPGDRIAIKSTYVRKRDLPFDNHGKPVSVMAVKAVGVVTSNLEDGKRVYVDWDSGQGLREWYFYTGRKTIWRVDPGKPMQDNLLSFAFDGRSQNIQMFLNDPYWASRYTGLRSWLVRGNNVNGIDLVPQWLSDGYVSLPAVHLRNVSPGINKSDLKPIVDEDYAHASYSDRGKLLDAFHIFLTRMQPGDLVVTVDQGRLFLGEISDEPHYTNWEIGPVLCRSVDWSGNTGFSLDNLAPELNTEIKRQYDVLDLTRFTEILQKLAQAEEEDSPPPPVEDIVLPPATNELESKLHVEREWLQECIHLLEDRPQLVFYGPPGTGKTYIARELARHIAGENVSLVQFHPAYSYEDFFEGFRPVASGGFDLKPGPMRRIVDQARKQPAVPHVLIIDEINRGNLAKVFGELYFLLEYRDENVELLYGDDDFSLPKNVFIIGAMNTADRSIALVDSAMRRRFAFLPLHPNEEPTNGVLRSWLSATGKSLEYAELLDALNNEIGDLEFAIGPSYFMRDAVYADGGLERMWRTSILPLLEEHYYGELNAKDIAKRFGLDAIRAKVASSNGEPRVPSSTLSGIETNHQGNEDTAPESSPSDT